MQYIYPEHLKSKATLFLWELKDVVIIGSIMLLAIFAFAQTKTLIPLLIGAVYAFLSIQFDGVSILGFIRSATSFFLVKQQEYEWQS